MAQRSGLRATLSGCLIVGGIAAWTASASAQTIDVTSAGQDLGVGARAMGMAGAFTAIADDATAISWNPAGPVEIERPILSVGFDPSARIEWSQPAVTRGALQRSASTETANARHFSHASVAAPLHLGSLKLVAQASYRRVLSFAFDREWSYEYKEVDPIVTIKSNYSYASSESGGLDVISAGFGVRLSPALSLGVAVERWTGKTTANWRDRDESASAVIAYDSDVEQSYGGFGARLGIRIAPHAKVRLALTARLPIQMDHEQTLSARLTREILETQIDVRRDGRVDWPASFGAGLAYSPRERLRFAADVTFAQWSKGVFDHDFTSTAVTTYTGQARPVERFSNNGTARTFWPTQHNADSADASARQADTMQTRFGLEYALRLGPKLSLPLRAGSWLDQQLERDADGKSPRALGFAVGLGLTMPHAALDGAWTYGSSSAAVEGATDLLKRKEQRLFLSVSLRP